MNVIDETIDYIVEHGWVKGSYRNTEGVCIVGALNMACLSGNTTPGVVSEARSLIRNVVKSEYPEFDAEYWLIEEFNDDAETSFNDVLIVLQKASAIWDEKHG